MAQIEEIESVTRIVAWIADDAVTHIDAVVRC